MLKSSRWLFAALIVETIIFQLAIVRLAVGAPPAHGPNDCIKITSKSSVLHLGSLDSFDITEAGTKAATDVLAAVENNNLDAARRTISIYQNIIPDENFGGEYTALQWLCEFMIRSPTEQQTLLQDKYVAGFYRLLADNNYAVLKEYLRRKYHLVETPVDEQEEPKSRHRFHEDFILFNNPRREHGNRLHAFSKPSA